MQSNVIRKCHQVPTLGRNEMLDLVPAGDDWCGRHFSKAPGVDGFTAGPQGVRNGRGHPIGNYKLCENSGLLAACDSWDITRGMHLEVIAYHVIFADEMFVWPWRRILNCLFLMLRLIILSLWLWDSCTVSHFLVLVRLRVPANP